MGELCGAGKILLHSRAYNLFRFPTPSPGVGSKENAMRRFTSVLAPSPFFCCLPYLVKLLSRPLIRENTATTTLQTRMCKFWQLR